MLGLNSEIMSDLFELSSQINDQLATWLLRCPLKPKMLSWNFIISPEMFTDIIKHQHFFQSNQSNNKLWPAVFINSKEVQKNTKENPI